MTFLVRLGKGSVGRHRGEHSRQLRSVTWWAGRWRRRREAPAWPPPPSGSPPFGNRPWWRYMASLLSVHTKKIVWHMFFQRDHGGHAAWESASSQGDYWSWKVFHCTIVKMIFVRIEMIYVFKDGNQRWWSPMVPFSTARQRFRLKVKFLKVFGKYFDQMFCWL